MQIVLGMQSAGILRLSGKGYEVTGEGSEWLQELGIDCDLLRAERRLFAPQCLDFTERRPHLGGALGAELLSKMVDRQWLVKSRIPRAVRLTMRGRTGLKRTLHLVFSPDLKSL